MAFNFNSSFNFFLFMFTLIGMHIMTFMPAGSGLYIFSNIIGWATVGVLIGLSWWKIAQVEKLYYSTLMAFIGIGMGLLFIPVLFQSQSIVPFLPRFFAILGAFSYLVSLYQLESKNNKYTILYIFLIGIAVESTIGMFQVFYINVFDLNAGYYQLLNGRPSGTFRQPNVMASFMATGVALSIFLFTRLSSKQVWQKKLCMYSIFTCSLLVVALQSRAGYLGLVASSFFLIPLFKSKFSGYKIILLLVLAGILSGIFTLTISGIKSRGTGIYTDGGVREEIYQISADLFFENPIMGTGYGTFEKSFREKLVISNVDENKVKGLENLDHPHNELLYWAAEGGIIAILGLLSFVVGFFYIYKFKIQAKDWVYLSLIFPLLIHTQLEFPFYISIVHFLLFVTLIWFIDSEKNKVSCYHLHEPKTLRVVGCTLSTIVSLFMLTGLHSAIEVNRLINEDEEPVKSLNNLTNPMIWQSYIQKVNFDLLYDVAIQTNDIELLRMYINTNLESMNHKPRAKIYDKMIQAIMKIEALGYKVDNDIKYKIYVDAKRLYPYIFTYKIN